MSGGNRNDPALFPGLKFDCAKLNTGYMKSIANIAGYFGMTTAEELTEFRSRTRKANAGKWAATAAKIASGEKGGQSEDGCYHAALTKISELHQCNLQPIGTSGTKTTVQLPGTMRIICNSSQMSAATRTQITNSGLLKHPEVWPDAKLAPVFGDSQGAKGKRAEHIAICYTFELLQMFPELSIDGRDTTDTTRLLGYTPDDWCRVLMLTGYFRFNRADDHMYKGSDRVASKPNIPTFMGGEAAPSTLGLPKATSVADYMHSVDTQFEAISKLYLPSRAVFPPKDVGEESGDELADEVNKPSDRDIDELMEHVNASISTEGFPHAGRTDPIFQEQSIKMMEIVARGVNWYRPSSPVLDPVEAEKLESFDTRGAEMRKIIEDADDEAFVGEDGQLKDMDVNDDKLAAKLLSRQAQNLTSSAQPSFVTAKEIWSAFFSLEEIKPGYVQIDGICEADGSPTIIMPWQLTGSVWMVMKFMGRLRGGLLSDEMGTGKTLTTLMAILLLHKIRVHQNQSLGSVQGSEQENEMLGKPEIHFTLPQPIAVQALGWVYVIHCSLLISCSLHWYSPHHRAH
jgi:hypothetical protein